MAKEDFVWPSTKADQDALNVFIDRGVNLRNEKEVITSDSKQLAEDAKDKFNIPSAKFNAYVAAQYDKDKFLENKEKIDQIASDLQL